MNSILLHFDPSYFLLLFTVINSLSSLLSTELLYIIPLIDMIFSHEYISAFNPMWDWSAWSRRQGLVVPKVRGPRENCASLYVSPHGISGWRSTLIRPKQSHSTTSTFDCSKHNISQRRKVATRSPLRLLTPSVCTNRTEIQFISEIMWKVCGVTQTDAKQAWGKPSSLKYLPQRTRYGQQVYLPASRCHTHSLTVLFYILPGWHNSPHITSRNRSTKTDNCQVRNLPWYNNNNLWYGWRKNPLMCISVKHF